MFSFVKGTPERAGSCFTVVAERGQQLSGSDQYPKCEHKCWNKFAKTPEKSNELSDGALYGFCLG